jgi:hypothetical protein
MAPTVESISKRLTTSTETGYELSNKLYRVLEALPSAVFEYGCFGGQLLYLAANFEKINDVLPSLGLEDYSQVLKDLEKLLDFSEDAYSEVKEALPQRRYDGGEIDLLLPVDAIALEYQIDALQIASTLVMAVLQVGGARPAGAIIPSSTRFAEAVVNQLKKAIRNLKCSQPKETKRRGAALKRAKTHTAITEFLDAILLVVESKETKTDDTNLVVEVDVESKVVEKKEDKSLDVAPEECDLVKLEHLNADPKEDGMPDYLHHNPDNVYAKVHVKDVDTRSLDFYGLPFSKAKENPSYFIIWKPVRISMRKVSVALMELNDIHSPLISNFT